MTERTLLPAEFAVLGLLAIRPMHGYEMARYFDRDELLDVCPIEQSVVYAYIRNVEERGLVRWDETRVGLRPPRKIYELTDAGHAALQAWLQKPVERLREMRLDFLLKLYFLHVNDPAAERTLVDQQIALCERYRQRLAERVALGAGFPRLVASSKLTAAEGTLTWLRGYAAELATARMVAS